VTKNLVDVMQVLPTRSLIDSRVAKDEYTSHMGLASLGLKDR
jgi:hypothetical protein